jgi:uncharacterized protein YerC
MRSHLTILKEMKRMTDMLAVRNCFNSGLSVQDLAKQTGKSVTTIRRWLVICP